MDELFYEIFSDLPRQGPGDSVSTLKAAKEIIGINENPAILDVGCGTGMQTLEMANYFGGKITAVDNHQPFLDELFLEAQRKGFANTITCLNADMLNPSFVDDQYDLIWAEGSIFVIGFEKGLKTFKKLLNPFGYVAVTEVSWLKNTPPKVLKEFWDREYPDINTVDNNLAIIESSGYKLINSFALSDSAWLDDFYVPLEKRLEKFRLTYHKDENALELIDKVQVEIEMFRKYSAFYGYIFYIMQNNS